MQTASTLHLAQKLRKQHDLTHSWRKAAAVCGVLLKSGEPHPALARLIAEKDYEPVGAELRQRIGLLRPPREKKPLTPFQMARLAMAEKTREILKDWKMSHAEKRLENH